MLILISSGPSFALSPIGYDQRVKNLILLEYIPDTYMEKLENPLTKVDYALLVAGFYQPHYYTRGIYMGGDVYKDVPNWANPYVDFCVKNGLLKQVSKSKFGADSLVSKEEFLNFLIKQLGHDPKEEDIYEFSMNMDLLNQEEMENLKASKELKVKDSLYLIYNAFSLVPKGEKDIILAEKMASKELLNFIYLEERGLNYKRLSEDDYFKYNKDKIDMNPKIKSYEEGITSEYGINNKTHDMVVEGDYIYYVTTDYSIDYLRIKEKNLKTGKTRTLVDKSGVYTILAKKGDYIYYMHHTDEVYNGGIFTGVVKIELRRLNIKTMEDKAVDTKEQVNVLYGGISYHFGNKYVYKLRGFNDLSVMPIEDLGKSKWKPIYKKQNIDLITIGDDDSFYGQYSIYDTSKPSTLIRIKTNGEVTEYGKFDFIDDVIQMDSWLYVSSRDIVRIEKNTKESKIIVKDAGITNIQYPWMYYGSDATYRMKLDTDKPVIQRVHYSYSDIYQTGGLVLYKNKAYVRRRYPDGVIKVFTLDMNTWERKEILDNRK